MKRKHKPIASRAILLTHGFLFALSSAAISAEAPPTEQEARAALRKAVSFLREEVATEGGYLWWYSEDLEERHGEGKASKTQVWVQPPGTPTVGMAMLRAWEWTGEAICLEGARDAAHALMRGRRASGGWGYSIEFDPEKRKQQCYDVDQHGPDHEPCKDRRNLIVYDDDTTQAAIRFLARYDKLTGFRDRPVNDCVLNALDAVLKTQYPNGGWPQRTLGAPDPDLYPHGRASYPDTWSRTWPGKDYKSYCTINDNVTPDLIRTLLVANDVYGHAEKDDSTVNGSGKYLRAAIRGGEFLIRAQMPDPQPAWAQQYDHDMHPAWARKFEPPAVVTRESYNVLLALMQLYIVTGEERFREPIPKAIAWLKKVQRPDGRFPRFLELRTDRPLYFNRNYELVYTDDDNPSHYAMITSVPIKQLEDLYARLDTFRMDYTGYLHRRPAPPFPHDRVERQLGLRRWIDPSPDALRRVIAALDDEGRWLEDGEIKCATFSRNLDALSSHIDPTPNAMRSVDPTWRPDPRQVGVMTFNIRYGTANDGPNHWDHRKDAVAQVLRDHQPEIVGIQEALRFQLDFLRERLPYYGEVGVGRDDGKEKGEYAPILYDTRRFKVAESGTFWLSETPEVPGSRHWGNSIPRICTWGRMIDRKSAAAFYVFNVHLDHVAQESRVKGVHLIRKRIAERAHPAPVVLTGDFNADEENPAIRALLGKEGERDALPVFQDAHRAKNRKSKNEATFNGWGEKVEGEKIDFVFVMKSEPPVEVTYAEIVRDRYLGKAPSDHDPVMTVLCLPAKAVNK